jgi:hypothetical protein
VDDRFFRSLTSSASIVGHVPLVFVLRRGAMAGVEFVGFSTNRLKRTYRDLDG